MSGGRRIWQASLYYEALQSKPVEETSPKSTAVNPKVFLGRKLNWIEETHERDSDKLASDYGLTASDEVEQQELN